MFCDQINADGKVIVNAGQDDLSALLDRMRTASRFSFSLARTRDMDSGIEFINTPEGTAIFGCEDSMRGAFSFYYRDPTKTSQLQPVGIYELPRYAFCDNVETVMQIAELFFREGVLDRHFSWTIDIRVCNKVQRGKLLSTGNIIPIEVFIAESVD
jgi:hypothetical protein